MVNYVVEEGVTKTGKYSENCIGSSLGSRRKEEVFVKSFAFGTKMKIALEVFWVQGGKRKYL